MANKQRLSTLKQGASAWNGWRKKNPALQPDLSPANLNGADLRAANLRSVNFSESLRRLARIARFIVADLSPHKSIAQELRAILSDTVIAVQPLLNGARRFYK